MVTKYKNNINRYDVGKTRIISSYIDDVFDEKNPSTIGPNYSEKVINKNGKDYQKNKS